MKKLLLFPFMAMVVCLAKAGSISLNVTKSNVLCYGDSTGSAQVTASGDSMYYYNWSSGSQYSFIRDVPAGTYTVTVTGAGSESATASVNITQPSTAVSVTASATATSSCTSQDGTLTASASGGTETCTYPWSNGQVGSSLTGLSVGVYTVTATDENGCTATASADVGSPATLVLSPSSVPPTCPGLIDGQASVSVSGDTLPLSYAWSTGDISDTASYLFAGTYYVTVTDVNLCSQAIAVTVNEPTPISLIITSSPSICIGAIGSGNTGSASVVASGGSGSFSYLWSTLDTTNSISGDSSGIYSVTVTSGACSAVASTVIFNSNGPVITMEAVNPSCFNGNDGAITAVVTGGIPPYFYTWIPGGGTVASIDSLISGQYTLKLYDQALCPATRAVTLVQPSYLVVNTYVYDVTCNGGQTGSITLSVSGGIPPYTFLWGDNSTNPFDVNLSDGTYVFTVTDVNSCITSSSASVIQPGALEIGFSVAGSSGSNGSDTALVSGGYTPYSYSWSNFESGMVDTLLAPGPYSVTVIDAKGCSITGSNSIPVVSGISALRTESFDMEVYPNPAQNVIYLISDRMLQSPVNIRIEDITGKLIDSKYSAPVDRYEIDVSEIASGIYFIDILADNQTLRKKVVVAR